MYSLLRKKKWYACALYICCASLCRVHIVILRILDPDAFIQHLVVVCLLFPELFLDVGDNNTAQS